MKQILSVLIGLCLLAGCIEDTKVTKRKTSTSVLPLRQMVQDEVTTTLSHGSFFLVGGSYGTSQRREDFVKVFAKVEDNYRVITIPLRNLRININNSLKAPILVIKHNGVYESDEIVCDYADCCGYNYKYIISCPEIYLPEKLIQITL